MFLSGVSIKDKTDRRVCVSVESQNKRGFDLSFATWSDTRVLAASATWVAFDKRYLSTPGTYAPGATTWCIPSFHRD